MGIQLRMASFRLTPRPAEGQTKNKERFPEHRKPAGNTHRGANKKQGKCSVQLGSSNSKACSKMGIQLRMASFRLTPRPAEGQTKNKEHFPENRKPAGNTHRGANKKQGKCS
jgi:hypothetical protein